MLVEILKIKYPLIYALLFISLLACEDKEVAPKPQPLPENSAELVTLLESTEDNSFKLEIYWALYKQSRATNEDLALSYLDKQADLAVELENDLLLGKANFGRALINSRNSDYVKAVDYYLTSISSFDKINEVKLAASALSNLGDIFATTGNYEYAEKFFYKAYQTHLNSGDPTRQIIATLNLGICNFFKKDPDFNKAERFFQKALELAGTIEDKQDYYFNRIYNQIGTVKYLQTDYKAAIHNYQLSLEYLGTGEKVEEKQAIAYANIGEAYMDQGNYSEAQRWLEKSLELSSYIKDNLVLVDIHNMTAELFQVQGDHQQATVYLEKAIDVADKDVINESLQETIDLIRVSYKFLQNSGKPVGVAKYETAFSIDGMQDSLEEELLEKANFKSLQAALGLSIELDNQIKEKKAEVEQRELISNIALSLGILLIIAAILGFIYTVNYRRTKRNRDEWKDVCLEVRDVLESIPN
ncbi:tetratricopeptide repeat protein [Fulvivirga sp. 29W222]|uniref:Tetratricopeptide repeat protein n=1 Tax=Fulvivirga marina TaxID=2494733 RepID=A0A937KDP2_9BACT|nr:tetratricopeptide repeat protein [Fulvivirga marina]MBL6446433.1 tetratricopeptide repeat protein [Fulvivirga marina]